jgi:GNAT superfamily N-acetyltransferase
MTAGSSSLSIAPAAVDDEGIRRHLSLFAQAFPGTAAYSEAYLRWLYRENPDGSVIGFDAFDSGESIATYVCIPCWVEREREPVKALLSLNTATHPRYRGQGLFTKLAEMTYDRAQQLGFGVVFGVANQNSVHGFSTKLGFQNVCGLDARIGVGRFPSGDVSAVRSRSTFHRQWSDDALLWRLANPKNRLSLTPVARGGAVITGRTQYPGISVQATLFQDLSSGLGSTDAPVPGSFLHVSLGLEPASSSLCGLSVSIPDRLKPSPLRLIYKSLRGRDQIDSRATLFRFIDFDPY